MDHQQILGSPGSGAEKGDSLEEIMRDCAQRVLRSATLAPSERQLCWDFSRTHRVHYPLAPLRRFLDLCPKAAPADAVWIAERLRGQILGRMPMAFIGVLDAFENEQESNREGDIWQFRYLREAHRGNRDGVRQALLGQWIATRLALDAVHLDGERRRSMITIHR